VSQLLLTVCFDSLKYALKFVTGIDIRGIKEGQSSSVVEQPL